MSPPYKLVARDARPEGTVVHLRGLSLGGRDVHVIAGPCSVESREQVTTTARAVRDAGATLLRGGAYKPRTSPYDFQGLKAGGLALLEQARADSGLGVVTEAMDVGTLDAVAAAADVVQIGARNMQNFALLEAAGAIGKPVLLKRGMGATILELLMAAEYVVAHGNSQVILCERGIRTFETMTRNTLDLNAVALLKTLTHLPVFVDPSHGVGVRAIVPRMALAAVAAGADGLLIEVHPDPPNALSDGLQSLDFDEFARAMDGVRAVARAVGRDVATSVKWDVTPR